MLTDADWSWLMLTDAYWCLLILTDTDWCWLMLTDADWCWLIRFNQGRSVPPEFLQSFLSMELPQTLLVCVSMAICPYDHNVTSHHTKDLTISVKWLKLKGPPWQSAQKHDWALTRLWKLGGHEHPTCSRAAASSSHSVEGVEHGGAGDAGAGGAGSWLHGTHLAWG